MGVLKINLRRLGSWFMIGLFGMTCRTLVCFGNAPSSESPVIQLVLNWKPEPQFGGFYAIKVDQLDKTNGFLLKILPGGSGTPTIQLIANQKVELALVAGDELVLAHERGLTQLKAIWATFQENPQALLVREEFAVGGFENLLNNSQLTLVWQEGLPYAQWIRKKWGKTFAVSTRPSLGGIGVFLENPKVILQGFVTSEPLLIPKEIKIHSFLIKDLGFNPYLGVVIGHQEFLRKNKDLVQKVKKTFLKGWQNYWKDPIKANELIKKENPLLNPDFLKNSAELQKKFLSLKGSSELGGMEVKRWEELIQNMMEAGLIRRKIEAKELMFIEDP